MRGKVIRFDGPRVPVEQRIERRDWQIGGEEIKYIM